MAEEDASIKLLQAAVDKLESIDKSIDFLAAAMTGMDPLDIEVGQQAYGRLIMPTQKGRGRPDLEELINLDVALLESIIEEELRILLAEKN